MAAPKKDIELLPHEEWERTSFGKVLKWILNVGRYIVIVTELVVILAFLSRFKLDRDLNNLSEMIEERQALIETNQLFENKFRLTQKRLNTIEEIVQNQAAVKTAIDDLSGLVPIDVSLSEMDFNRKEIRLSAVALSEDGLATFLNNLQESPRFNQLTISQLSSGTEKGIGIKIDLKINYQPIES